MNSTRSRNKLCLSLDNSSGNVSGSTVHLNRWSEVVPPKTALTFAALWDPEDGMVTFSGASLLESESLSGRLPLPDLFDDDYSQFVSFDRDAEGGTTNGENTATLATFQDVFNAFLREPREHLNTKAGQGAPRGLQTRASSTFDGLDVYSHDVQVKSTRSLRLSCVDLLDMESSFRSPSAFGRLRLRSDLMLDSYRPESDSESISGSKPAHLKSRFSATTTSTSNYVDVATNASQSVRISETLPIPEWAQSNECISPAGSWPFLPRRRRVLRKRRPFDGDTATSVTTSAPCTPRKVTPKSPTSSSPCSPSSSSGGFPSSTTLAVENKRRGRLSRASGRSISAVPTPPNMPSRSSRLKLRFTFLSKRKSRRTSSDSEGWVCIEVTPVIRQHYIADPDED